MSGPRPLHQFRRGAIYAVRFRVPADLVKRLGTTELSRSLRTADPMLARRLTNEATAWFRHMMEQVRAMPDLTRADLNAAGDAYFAKLARDAMVVDRLDASQVDLAAAEQIGASQARVTALNDQFRALSFDLSVKAAARQIARKAGAQFFDLSTELQSQALHLAARAQREQMRLFIHSFEHPGEPFAPSRPSDAWPTEERQERHSPGSTQLHGSGKDLALEDAVTGFLGREVHRGLGQSSTSETTRVLTWLLQAFGDETPVASLSKADVRGFRDGLQRLDRRNRGKRIPFASRQTADIKHQTSAVTAARYWNYVSSFFRYLLNEGHIAESPTSGLEVVRPVKSGKRETERFTTEELKLMLDSPLYAGHDKRSLMKTGSCLERGSYWWSGMLGLFTGMRAGEVAQLEVSDFDFAGQLPVIHVRTGGVGKKTLKTNASARDIPIAPQLLELGLKAFVENRSKGISARVFPDVGLGQGARKSDGLTKFWSRYLRAHGLWKEGRATHVFRHTFAQALRDVSTSEEVIGSLLGHAAVTVTAKYGGAGRPMHERAEAIRKIDFGFDVPARIKSHGS